MSVFVCFLARKLIQYALEALVRFGELVYLNVLIPYMSKALQRGAIAYGGDTCLPAEVATVSAEIKVRYFRLYTSILQAL